MNPASYPLRETRVADHPHKEHRPQYSASQVPHSHGHEVVY